MDLTVRDLRKTDVPELRELYAQLHPDDEPVEASRFAELWDAIEAREDLVYLGAFMGEVLVAVANAAIVPNLTRGARPYAVVENVVTDGRHRRRGAARVVMRALLERCWDQGCYKVMLLSAARRGAAHELYVALGFDEQAKRGFVARAPNRT